MDGKTIQCLPNPLQHVYLSSKFPSYTMLKSMRKSKNRYLSIYLTFFNLPRPAATAAATATA